MGDEVFGTELQITPVIAIHPSLITDHFRGLTLPQAFCRMPAYCVVPLLRQEYLPRMTVPSHPWASVIVPIKDERDNLVPLIEGLLTVMNSHAASQTRPFEIIFVDDGSSDGSSEELDRLAAQHPEVTTLPPRPKLRQDLRARRGLQPIFRRIDHRNRRRSSTGQRRHLETPPLYCHLRSRVRMETTAAGWPGEKNVVPNRQPRAELLYPRRRPRHGMPAQDIPTARAGATCTSSKACTDSFPRSRSCMGSLSRRCRSGITRAFTASPSTAWATGYSNLSMI